MAPRWVGLIDPEKQTVLFFLLSQQVEAFDRAELQLPAPDFARTLSLTIGELFGWLLE